MLSSATLSATPSLGKFNPFSAFKHFLHDEEGATLVEYVLLIALIAAVAVGAVTLLGTNANAKLTTAAGTLQ